MLIASAWAVVAIGRLALAVIAGVAAQLLASAATPAPRPQRPLTAADSARLVRRAHSAQSEFEILHRGNLPTEFGGGSGSCDIHIGRFCYWPDDGDDSPPPPEPARIQRERERLLAVLDSIGALIPHDDWVVGQRVRYRVDAHHSTDAIAVAQHCGATPSWCAALAGFALHEAGSYASADSAFTAALALMSESDRCRWTDIAVSLSDDLADRFHKLECAQRDSLARRIWWLSAPLYLEGAHDLRAEHFARVTRGYLEQDARSPQITWGDDVRELILRYGWPTWFTRQLPPPGSMRDPSVTGHDPSPSFDFYAPSAVVDSPFAARAMQWDMTDRAARTRYAPAYLRRLHQLPAQVSAFRRGDSAIVVASVDARGDTTLDGHALRLGLFAWPDPGHEFQTTRIDSTATGVLQVTAPWAPLVIGVEILAPDVRAAARARFGYTPGAASAAGRGISDLLLYAPAAAQPADLGAALSRMLPTNFICRTQKAGIYWETYGLPPQGQHVAVTVTMTPTRRGVFRRAAEALHLAARATPLSVDWQEVPDAAHGVASRGVSLDFSQLAAGWYELQLTVTPAGEGALTVSRDVELGC